MNLPEKVHVIILIWSEKGNKDVSHTEDKNNVFTHKKCPLAYVPSLSENT